MAYLELLVKRSICGTPYPGSHGISCKVTADSTECRQHIASSTIAFMLCTHYLVCLCATQAHCVFTQAQHNGYASAAAIPDTPMSPLEERQGYSPHANPIGPGQNSPYHKQGSVTQLV